ncbi:MAG: protein-disulfide reductase DsbD [Gammaproteobacteria bacterium]|nr:protein-disulfide reductase DsbD [Gammaproteobacteria bacterium]
MYKKLIALALLLPLFAVAAAEDEFLKPDQAFAISAGSEGNKAVAFNWRIADGYYLYRSKFRFLSDTAGVELGEPDLPPSLTKNDPIFGEVEIYRDQVTVLVPLDAVPPNTDTLTLKARSQGCADAGICYPPHTQTVLVAMNPTDDLPPPVDPTRVEDYAPAGSAPPLAAVEEPSAVMPIEPVDAPSGGDAPLAELAALGEELGIGVGEDDILPPEQAFQVNAFSGDGERVRVQWTIAEGTYLYQDKVKLSLAADGVQLGVYELPPPDIKKDSIKPDGSIGDVAVYHDAIDLDIPLLRSNTAAAKATLTAQYQGCAERGICYPPQKQVFELDLPAVAAATAATPEQMTAAAAPAPTALAATTPAAAASTAQSEQDQIAAMIAGQSTWVVVGAFFLIGLGLAFTPCVFPMIPILSGIITGHGSQITARKAFMLSLVYVLAMALTYTVAGVFAALAGENLQAMLQNPVAITVFALIFVALAMSMFGFYDLQLPSSLQSKLSEISNQQQGGSLAGAGIMGLLSALIVGPCVAPPLAGALIYIGQTGDAVLGGLALFAMSMGMGAPLIAIGTSAGKLLPRAGAWMDAVKAVFGVVMLGVAIYLLERVISPGMAMVLWGTLLVVSAIYMGALSPVADGDGNGWRKLWKGLGVVVLIYGALFLVGVAANGKDTLQPLRGVLVGGGMGGAGAAQHAEFKRIKTVADLNGELATAKSQGKAVMLDFYADWCVYCIQMEKNTFPDPAVQAAMSQMVLLQADVTDNDDDDKALQKHIGIPAPPAMIFWGPDGAERRHLRLLGFKGPEEFAPHLREALKP